MRVAHHYDCLHGYTLEALARQADPAVDAALDSTDLLIDGPFVETLSDNAGEWRGSRNQRLIYAPASHSAIRSHTSQRATQAVRAGSASSRSQCKHGSKSGALRRLSAAVREAPPKPARLTFDSTERGLVGSSASAARREETPSVSSSS